MGCSEGRGRVGREVGGSGSQRRRVVSLHVHLEDRQCWLYGWICLPGRGETGSRQDNGCIRIQLTLSVSERASIRSPEPRERDVDPLPGICEANGICGTVFPLNGGRPAGIVGPLSRHGYRTRPARLLCVRQQVVLYYVVPRGCRAGGQWSACLIPADLQNETFRPLYGRMGGCRPARVGRCPKASGGRNAGGCHSEPESCREQKSG